MTSAPETRVCTRCGETKPVSAFSPRRDRPGGYRSWCRQCVNDHARGVDPPWRGTDGPPLPVTEHQTRPCLARRKAQTEAKWDFIARYAGRRTPEWIGTRLGLSARAVVRFMWRHGLAPTTRDDLLRPIEVAEILGCTQQWVVRLIKAGRLSGYRNPGGTWWLVPHWAVERYLKDTRQPTRAPAWLGEPSGWPQVVLARHHRARSGVPRRRAV